MKRLLVISALLLLILSQLTACAPVETPRSEADIVTKNVDTENLKAVYYLLDDSSNITYGVYEFQLNGKNCVVIADVYLAPAGDSNSAPALYCQPLSESSGK